MDLPEKYRHCFVTRVCRNHKSSNFTSLIWAEAARKLYMKLLLWLVCWKALLELKNALSARAGDLIWLVFRLCFWLSLLQMDTTRFGHRDLWALGLSVNLWLAILNNKGIRGLKGICCEGSNPVAISHGGQFLGIGKSIRLSVSQLPLKIGEAYAVHPSIRLWLDDKK